MDYGVGVKTSRDIHCERIVHCVWVFIKHYKNNLSNYGFEKIIILHTTPPFPPKDYENKTCQMYALVKSVCRLFPKLYLN